MKFTKQNLALVIMLGFLSSCSDNMPSMPKVFSGNEVPNDVMAEPRLVPVPAPNYTENAPWQRLGDVPFKPKNFSTQPMIDASKQQMLDQRMIGDAERDMYAKDLAPASAKTPSNHTVESSP